MAFRRYGRRRILRRARRRIRPRRSRYLRKRRLYGRRRRSGGTLSKLIKNILPTVPIKYVETDNANGSYGSRTWWSKTIGDVNDAYNYRNYLPAQSNLFDTGSSGTSTNLYFQQYGSKKLKLRHVTTFTMQNLSNVTMILTAHIGTFRKDSDSADLQVADVLYKDCSATAGAATGEYQIDKASTVPSTSYIGNFYNYPQFTFFSSSLGCSIWKIRDTKKIRIPPGGWAKFRLNTGYKEFDSKWLVENAAQAGPTRHLKDWSKTLMLTWHGELVQKLNDSSAVTLAATDWMMYMTHSLTLKAVPFHRQSIVYKNPINMVTTTPFPWTPQVRPKVVVQVNQTSKAVEEDAS